MVIKLEDHESVRRDGESWSIGDKVYSIDNAHFGVGYIQEIEFVGVHFGFRAKIKSGNLDEPQWYDARNISHDMPAWVEHQTETKPETSS